MAQHDGDIANQAGAAFRADLNNLATALFTLSSGGSAPAVTFAHMLWKDTATSKLKMRNAGNTGWIELFSFDEVGNVATVLGAFDISGLTAETAPALADALAFHDASAGASRRISFQNFFATINVMSAIASVALDDKLLAFDASGSAAGTLTPAGLFAALNLLTEDTTPDPAADFVLTYDASAGAVKKVKPQNLGGAAGGLTLIESGSLVGAGSTKAITDIPASYNSLILQLRGASCSAIRDLVARASINNGSSYAATGYSGFRWLDGSAAMEALTGTSFGIGTTIFGGSSDSLDVTLELRNYAGGPDCHFTMTAFNSGGLRYRSQGAFRNGADNIDALQLSWSGSGNFDAGTFALYGAG